MNYMISMIKKVSIFLGIIILPLYLHCAFKDPGFSAKGVGLGGAFCAISDDATGIMYNSAGIGQSLNYELNFVHTKLFVGLEDVNLNLNYAAIVVPVKNFGTSGVTYTELLESSYKERMVILTFAKEISPLLNLVNIADSETKYFLGWNLKYLQTQFVLDQRTVNDPVFAKGNSKNNYTFDFGFLMVKDKISFGLNGKNLTQPDMGFVIKDEIPMELRAGFGYKFLTARLSGDVSYRNQQWGEQQDKLNVHLGLENSFFNDILTFLIGANMTELGCGFVFKIPTKTKFESYINFSFSYPFYVRETSGNYRLGLMFRI